MRRRYAYCFNVPLKDVKYHEFANDEAEVWAPSRPDLPRWTTGEMP